MVGHNDLLACCLIPPFLVAPGRAGKEEAVALEHRDHVIWVNRGVPRSPNRYLDEFSVRWQVQIAGGEVQADCFRDALSRFFLRGPGRSTSRQLGTDGGPALRLGIVFEDHAELHDHSISGRGMPRPYNDNLVL